METEDINILIAKFLSKQATQEEQQLVNQFVQSSAENQQYFDALKTVFEKTDHIRPVLNIDTDKAWQKLNKQLQRPSQTVVLKRNLLRIAAIFVIGITTWAVWKNQKDGSMPQQITLANHQTSQSIALSDKSNIILRENSTLIYPKTFAEQKERTVQLNAGEAFFDIAHNPKQPFVVNINNNAQVKVLGTKFTVKHRTNLISVALLEGKIAFQTQAIYQELLPKQTLTFNTQNQELTLGKTTQNQFAFFTKNLVFEDTPLTEVVKDLENYSGKKFTITDKSLENLSLTASFSNKDIEQITDVIAYSLNLKITKINDNFALSRD